MCSFENFLTDFANIYALEGQNDALYACTTDPVYAASTGNVYYTCHALVVIIKQNLFARNKVLVFLTFVFLKI